MAIAALILHLEPDATAAVSARLAGDPSLALGPPQPRPEGALLPVVATSRDAAAGEDCYRALAATPGVRFVDVVMVDFSDEPAQAASEGAP